MKEYFFVFQGLESRLMPWWCRLFLKPGFAHVFGFSRFNDDDLLVVEPLLTHTQHTWVRMEALDLAEKYIKAGMAVVGYQWFHRPQVMSHDITQFVPGCVTHMKTLIGKPLWVFSPWGFYNWLLENGGVRYDLKKIAFLKSKKENLTEEEKKEV